MPWTESETPVAKTPLEELTVRMDAAMLLLSASLPEGCHCAVIVFQDDAEAGVALVSSVRPERTMVALRYALQHAAPQ